MTKVITPKQYAYLTDKQKCDYINKIADAPDFEDIDPRFDEYEKRLISKMRESNGVNYDRWLALSESYQIYRYEVKGSTKIMENNGSV